MKKLFALLAVLFVSIGAKADINVYDNTNGGVSINGQSGYAIYSWSQAGELAAFLNGEYTGNVYFNSSPVSEYQNTNWFSQLKSAAAIKIGGSQEAPFEVVGTTDLQALAKLTGLVYLDMDMATPASDADFSKIEISSNSLEAVTLPTGTSKEQVVAANSKLNNKGAKVVAAMSVITTPKHDTIKQYYFTLPGSTDHIIYNGNVTESDGHYYGNVSSQQISRPLTYAEGYPQFTYTNNYCDDKVFPVDAQYVEECTNPYNPSLKYYIAKIYNLPLKVTYQSDSGKYKYQMPITWQEFIIDADDPRLSDDKSYVTIALDEPFQFGNQNDQSRVKGKFSYTYYDLNGQLVTTPETENALGSVIELSYTNNNQELYYEEYEQTTYLTTSNLVACVNNAGFLSFIRNNMLSNSNGQLNNYKEAKNITVIGNINNNDLTELSASNFGSVEYLNMKDAVLDGNITTISSKGTAAIILPTIKVGTSTRNVNTLELAAIQAQGGYADNKWNPTYHCLAYFDSSNSNKLNVYTIDETLGRLAPVVSTSTAITFIPKYNNDSNQGDLGGFQSFMGADLVVKDEQGKVKLPETMAAFAKISGEFKKLPAISMDMSRIAAYMNPDFRVNGTAELNPNTHYLTVYGNAAAPYNEAYDFTSETANSNYKYPSTVWVVSTYKVESDEAFELDSDGNRIVISDDGQGHIKYLRTGEATYAQFGGRFLEATEPTNIVYVRTDKGLTTDGTQSLTNINILSGVKNYLSNDQKNASRQIFVGYYTNELISAIDNNYCSDHDGDTFDFMSATFEPAASDASLDCVVNLDNDHVEFILLPDNHEFNINPSFSNRRKANEENICSFSAKCDHLLCVGSYNITEDKLYTWSRKNLDNNGKQIPSVFYVTSLILPNRTGNGSICTGLKNVEMSGYLSKTDIDVQANVDKGGLTGASIVSANFKYATFYPNSEMCFTGAGFGTALTSITLPYSKFQTELPSNSLNTCGGTVGFSEICIPYNIENIGEYVFQYSKVVKFTTTDDEDEKIDNGNGTITLSSNLKSIGTGTFVTTNKDYTDVYVLATEAPKCAANTFDSNMYCGNGTFPEGNWKHPITRENYKTSGSDYYAILHFPSDVDETNAKRYTDIYREYSLIDETADYDGNGKLKRWPNHSEIYRAYNQAVSGVTWNDWIYIKDGTDYSATVNYMVTLLLNKYPEMSQEEAEAKVVELGYWDENHQTINYDKNKKSLRYTNGQVVNAIAPQEDGTMDYSYLRTVPASTDCPFYEYIGWHQFVLTDYYRYEDEQLPEYDTYKKLDFYTLCFPYDLTEEELISLIGAPSGTTLIDGNKNIELEEAALPEIYTLKSVKRNSSSQYVTLGISKNLAKQAKEEHAIQIIEKTKTIDNKQLKCTTWNYEGSLKTKKVNGVDKPVFLEGGYPYLVKPIVPVKEDGTVVTFSNLAEYMMSISDLTEDDLGNKMSIGETDQYVAAPMTNHRVIAEDQSNTPLTWNLPGETTSHPYYYYFQGTYIKQSMPMYVYYLGQKSGVRNFFYHENGDRNWNQFSALIGGKGDAEAARLYGVGGTSAKTSGTPEVILDIRDDIFESSGSEVKVNFTFEDEDGFDQAVAIETIDGKVINSIPADADVYSLTGQFVGKSLEGVSKGVYIVNGKKVIIK